MIDKVGMPMWKCIDCKNWDYVFKKKCKHCGFERTDSQMKFWPFGGDDARFPTD